MLRRAQDLVEDGGYIHLDQFRNPHAATGYRRMGTEIVDQIGRRIDVVCGAVGTAGMIMGVGATVRAAWPDARIVPAPRRDST